jgi:hypothetical protein
MPYFSNQNPNLGKILEGLAKEDFSRFGILCQEKSGNPGFTLNVDLKENNETRP